MQSVRMLLGLSSIPFPQLSFVAYTKNKTSSAQEALDGRGYDDRIPPAGMKRVEYDMDNKAFDRPL